MATPPPRTVFSTADIPNPPEWLEKVLAPLNAFVRPTSEALEGGLTFAENFAGEVKSISVTPPPEWVPVSFGPGWGQWVDSNYPPCSLRKDMFGNVEARGLADLVSGSGQRVIAFADATASYAPAAGDYSILPNVAADAPASSIIRPEGIDTLAGSTARWWCLSGLRWVAANRTPPRWAKPVELTLGQPGKPFPGRPGFIQVLGCYQAGKVAEPAIVSGVDWSIRPPSNRAGRSGAPGILIHRVWGLSPGVEYVLTLLVIPE